jgi:3-oxoacyl-[acyl-carrier-protein] synthase II
MTRRGDLAIAGAGLAHNLGGLEQLAAVRDPLKNPSPPDTTELAAAMPGISLRRIPRYARMALLAAIRALDDAGWQQEPEPDGIALVVGTAYGGVQMSVDFMDSIIDYGPRLSSPTAFSHSVNNMGSGLISLLLNLRGPCLTVSQFDLSFAGAVSAATAWLHAGRARRVLVGSVDETDDRFTHCCPQITKTGLSQTEGAAFLCLELPNPAKPNLCVRWDCAPSEAEPGKSHPHPVVFASGKAVQGENGYKRHDHLYGHSPLAHALDTLLALHEVRQKTTARIDCLCASPDNKRTAVIEIRGPQL